MNFEIYFKISPFAQWERERPIKIRVVNDYVSLSLIFFDCQVFESSKVKEALPFFPLDFSSRF